MCLSPDNGCLSSMSLAMPSTIERLLISSADLLLQHCCRQLKSFLRQNLSQARHVILVIMLTAIHHALAYCRVRTS